MEQSKAFIRDCAVVALASYISLSLSFSLSWENWIIARWILSDGLGKPTLLMAIIGCSAGSLIIAVAIWRVLTAKNSSRLSLLLLSIFIATTLAELISRLVARPFPDNNCWGISRSDMSSSMFLLLQPVATVTVLIATRNAENILRYSSGEAEVSGATFAESQREPSDPTNPNG